MRETFVLEDVLGAMIGLETAGNANYRALAEMTDDGEARRLFSLLADQELKHKTLYETFRSHLESAGPVDAEYEAYVRLLLQHHVMMMNEAPKPAGFAEGFALAVQLEKDTIFFLNEMRPVLGPVLAEKLEPLLAEERKHLEYLMNYQK